MNTLVVTFINSDFQIQSQLGFKTKFSSTNFKAGKLLVFDVLFIEVMFGFVQAFGTKQAFIKGCSGRINKLVTG